MSGAPTGPSLKRSLATVFGGRFMRAFIQLLSAAAIARLLTPEDMGIFAVASAAIAISTAMAEFGISLISSKLMIWAGKQYKKPLASCWQLIGFLLPSSFSGAGPLAIFMAMRPLKM
ncbi:hypothetical protein JCM17846_25280 [Iodidimonas nitroreducens]|uniref:Uncharacterized protein n=1 Tax=Iodidimonas nitroreducens TaxID=1236968 RepID=A0A5A7ND31_9PROT|nr:oligosaccharide flippase family protein [Iodidimonas nitroreducens]GER04846.1 hypothetical protein JCM17846_25280 [Iodidimonas nitroreducens]